MRNFKRRFRALHIGAAVAAIIATVSVSLVFSGGGGQPTHISIEIGGPHGTPVQTIQVPAAAVQQVDASDVADHKGMRDETPPGASPSLLNAVQRQQDALAESDQLPLVTPLAAPEQRGCRTQLVQNYSSRRGVRPREWVLHYTVSPNRPGRSDVNAVVYEFDQPAFAASSNYVIDNEGNCAYIVRESDKAWTQAALNPDSISVEVINTGREPTYAGAKGLAKLALVASDSLCRWDIPVQKGLVVDGLVKRAGIVDHGMLGVAGGGHHDISPFSVDQVVTAVQAARAHYGCHNGKPGSPPAPKPKPKPAPKPLPPCTIRNVQAALDRRGAHLAVDGVAGPRTAAALTAWQHAHKLNATGRADVGTCKSLHLEHA